MRILGRHACGGSILNERWVLTAAHCVYGGSASMMTVVTGSNKLNSGGDSYKVKRFVHHKDFDIYRLHNDIALLELEKDIVLGPKVRPIVLNTNVIGVDKDLILSGWGTTSYPGNIPNDLQYINLKSIDSLECNEKNQNTGLTVDSTQICTFTQSGQGGCHGDSGGPLTADGKLVGIVSWGQPCAVGYPDVFTRVSSYIGWIIENMD